MRGKVRPRVAVRGDWSFRPMLYEPFWQWLEAGQPKTAESERLHFSAAEWWLTSMFTQDWHPCYDCGESAPNRVVRLLKVAVNQGGIIFSDDEQVLLDDANTKNLIAVCDELEPAPSWEWWREHYDNCPARLRMLEELPKQRAEWEKQYAERRNGRIEKAGD